MSTLTLTGNLAADPELRFTPSGNQIARFTVLENRRRPDGQGGFEDAEPNRFHVQASGQLAEHIIESCTKGLRVVVEGDIVTDRWTDKDSGQERTSQHIKATEVGVSLRFHTVTATKAPAREQRDA